MNRFDRLEAPAPMVRPPLRRAPPDAPRPAAALASLGARRIAFRFGLTGLAWGRPGPVALLLPAAPGRPLQFRSLVEPLVAAGLQVIALEPPAQTPSSTRASHLMEMALAVQEVAPEIRNLEALIGHSLGASAVALALAAGLPAERAVLLAPPDGREPPRTGSGGWLGLPAAAARRLLRRCGHADGVAAHELDLTRRVRELQRPALIVHDQDDRQVAFSQGVAIAAAWPGAQLLQTHGLGHWRLLTEPAVVRQVTMFLTGAPPAPQGPARH